MNPQRKGIRATTAALSVIVVVLAGSLVFVTMTPQLVTHTTTTTFTQTSTAMTTETTTETTTLTKSLNANASINTSLLTACSEAKSPTEFAVTAGTNSAGVICFQLYYYNSTAPLTINLTQALSIQAFKYPTSGNLSNQGNFNGALNFTVIPSQSQLVIGGPNSLNEGTTITYALFAKAGASGTYAINFPGMELYPQQPAACANVSQLIAGTGQPYYYPPGGLCTISKPLQPSGTHTLSGIPYPLYDGFIYFRIAGIVNSTQIAGT